MRKFLLLLFLITVAATAFAAPSVTGQQADGPVPNEQAAVTHVYWTEVNAGTIRRGNADGSGSAQTCVTGQNNPRGLVIASDLGKMYWLERGANRMRRANLNCPATGVEIIGPSLSNPDRMALDLVGGKIYWTENAGTDRIRRANLDGSSPETVLTGLSAPVGIAIDRAHNYIYWTEYGSDSIRRASLNGANPQLVLQLAAGADPLEIALDVGGNRMYWASGELGAIYSATLDGGGMTVWRSLPRPHALTIDTAGGKLYWSDWTSHEIRRDNLNKSNNQMLFNASDGVDDALGLALHSESTTCYTLSRSHIGSGSDPTASPVNSAGCATDSYSYTAGQSITLTAVPLSGWRVKNWSGTINDASTSATNTVTMPAGNHEVSVTYEVIPTLGYHLFAPAVLTVPYVPPPCFTGHEQEPNNNGSDANGPLCRGATITGWPHDLDDFFWFETTSAGFISVSADDLFGQGMQLVLYYQSVGGPVSVADTEQSDGLHVELPNAAPGRYYIRIYTAKPDGAEQRVYVMQATFP